MPIPTVTPFPGTLPDLADPVTFDARMTTLANWLADVPSDVMTELVAAIAAINTALNDNGTVLDATAAAVARTTNATTPVDTSGTSTAYTITPAVAVAAYTDGQAFLVRPHVASGSSPTLAVGALAALPIRLRNSSNVLAAPAAGIMGQYEEFLLTVTGGGTLLEITSQPIAEITQGIGMVPIITKTVSGAATVDFTEFENAKYPNGYLFTFRNLLASSTAQLWCRTSSDGGATFDASSGAYEYHTQAWTGAADTPTVSRSLGQTQAVLAILQGTNPIDPLSGEFRLHGCGDAVRQSFMWKLVSTATTMHVVHGGGRRTSSADIDAIRFMFASGTITGSISMFGLR